MNIADIAKLVISLTIPIAIGYGFVHFFFARTGLFFPEKIALSYGLGFGYITLCMFYLSIIGVTFNMIVLFIPAICLFAGAFLYKKYGKKGSDAIAIQQPQPQKKTPLNPLLLLLIAVIAGNIILIFFRTILVEKDIWDSWAMWAFKAKIFFTHKIVPLGMFGEFNTAYGHWDYPQHVPLAEAWILTVIGYWNDLAPRIIFPIYFLGLCIAVFYFLLRYVSLTVALIGTAFLATFRGLEIWTIGTITETVMLYYYIISFLLLYRWFKENNMSLLVLSSLFAGFAAWTKNDGLFLLLLQCLILISFLLLEKTEGKSIFTKQFVVYAVICTMIIAPWLLFKSMAGLGNDVVNKQNLQIGYILGNIGRVPDLFKIFILGFVFNFERWNIVWLMGTIFLIYSIAMNKFYFLLKYILFSIVLQFAMYIFIFIIFHDPVVYVNDTLGRLMLSPAILSILYSCLFFDHNITLESES